MTGGARSPEELETLFEDAVMLDDREALQQLFETGAILVTAAGAELRGRDEITSIQHEGVVAERARVLQASRTALLLGSSAVSVVRRGTDRTWRFTISVRRR